MATHGKLKAIAVTRLTTTGMYSDGGGLWLQIKNGGKSWIFRFMLNGKARYYGLGSFDICTLAEARAKALECRKLLAQGIDLIENNRKLFYPPEKLLLQIVQSNILSLNAQAGKIRSMLPNGKVRSALMPIQC